MVRINKQKYFFYVILLLMANTFFPLLFNNLPYFLRSHYIFAIVWLISLILFVPKIFTEKLMALVLIYGLFLIIMLSLFWLSIDDWNRNLLIKEYLQIAVAISVISYFKHTKDYITYAKITKWILIFLFITAVMSIISSVIDPMYARNLIGASSIENLSEREAVLSYKKYGGGTYASAVVFMCLFPLLIYYYKNIKKSLFSKKILLVFTVVFFLALLSIQIFTNILIAVIFGVFAFFGAKKIKKSIVITIVIISIISIIPKEFYVKSLITVSNQFQKQENIKYKLNDLAIFINTGANIKNSFEIQ